MPTQFILDTREKSLQALFDLNRISYETKQLDLGDVLILYSKGEIKQKDELSDSAKKLLRAEEKEEKIEDKIHTITIERKSYKDLKSSICDGRYHEQKSRYIKLPKGTMYYIFENNDASFAELEWKQFLGAYIHTMVRDGIPVLNTTSLQQTYEFLLKISQTLEQFGIDGSNVSCSMETTQIKKKKAVGKEVYQQQIQCIPGISAMKAKPIVEAYPSMSILISALEQGTFQIKGIGKVLVERIKESLLLSTKKKITFTD